MADQYRALRNLSILSLRTIFSYVSPERIFQASIESESFNKFVEFIKVPVDEIQVSVENPSESIISCFSFNHRLFSFGCIDPRRTVDRRLRARINGKPMTLYETVARRYFFFGVNYYGTENFSLVDMEDITSHLVRLFRPNDLTLNLVASPLTINCVAWKIPFHTICITCTVEYIITWEDLKQVFENETVTKVFIEFKCEQGERDLEVIRQTRASLLEIPKMIKCEELACEDFDFFSVDDLIDSRCKRIFLINQVNQLTNSEVNKLLKFWKTGTYLTNLERFSIKKDTYNRTLEIIEGIELHNEYPTHLTYIEEYSERSDKFKNKGGLVIKRETDNVLATIMIQHGSIEFVVWKDGVELEPLDNSLMFYNAIY